MKDVVQDPSCLSQYVNDPEIFPILCQVNNILQSANNQEPGEGEESEEEEVSITITITRS